MVDHLMKRHGFEDKARAREKAAEFLVPSEKSIWSCGFCVCIFTSFKDRLGHLGIHFKHGLTRNEWHLTTEIQGLLLQPLVEEAWVRLLAATHYQNQPAIRWEGPAAINVRNELQDGTIDMRRAQQLSQAAYAASNLNEIIDVSKYGSLTSTNSTGTKDQGEVDSLVSLQDNRPYPLDQQEDNVCSNGNPQTDLANELMDEEVFYDGMSFDPIFYNEPASATLLRTSPHSLYDFSGWSQSC